MSDPAALRGVLLQAVDEADRELLPSIIGIMAEVQATALAKLQAPEELLTLAQAADRALMTRDAFARLARTKTARTWRRAITRKNILVERRAFERWLAAGNHRVFRARDAVRRAGRDESPSSETVRSRERVRRRGTIEADEG